LEVLDDVGKTTSETEQAMMAYREDDDGLNVAPGLEKAEDPCPIPPPTRFENLRIKKSVRYANIL
jgi:hypothetical protein